MSSMHLQRLLVFTTSVAPLHAGCGRLGVWDDTQQLHNAVQLVDENLIVVPADRSRHVTLYPGWRTDPACLNMFNPTLYLRDVDLLLLVIDWARDECVLIWINVAPSGQEEFGEVVTHQLAGYTIDASGGSLSSTRS